MASATGRFHDLRFETPGERLLSQCIRRAVQSSLSEVFFVARRDWTPKLRDALGELRRIGLITEYPEVALSPEVRADYIGYFLEYGTFLDWSRFTQTASKSPGRPTPRPLVPPVAPEDMKKYALRPEWLQDALG